MKFKKYSEFEKIEKKTIVTFNRFGKLFLFFFWKKNKIDTFNEQLINFLIFG